MPRISISIIKSDLDRSYNKEKLTTYEIADIYNCCQATVWKRLHQFNIKPRIYRVDLSDKRLKYLYLKCKFSTWQIEKVYGYSRGTVYRKLNEYDIKTRNISESHIIYPRFDFSGNKIKKAYIIGFAMGDLRARIKSKMGKTIYVDCGSTQKNQIKLIKNIFGKYGRVWVGKPDKKSAVQIECCLNRSFKFLLKKRKVADEWITKNKRYFLSFIAGFTDAEGCISIDSGGKVYYSLGNYNKKLLVQINNFLVENNMASKRKLYVSRIKGRRCFKKYFHNNDYWQLRIMRKKYLILFFQLIGKYIKHLDKIKDIEIAFKNIEKRNKKFGYLRMN